MINDVLLWWTVSKFELYLVTICNVGEFLVRDGNGFVLKTKYQYQFSIKSLSFIIDDIKILFVLHYVTKWTKM